MLVSLARASRVRAMAGNSSAEVAVELTEAYGEGDPLPRLHNVATMTRDEMLDCLADGAVDWSIPDIEVVYPGAIDPTA